MRSSIEGCIDEINDGIIKATLIDASGWTYYAEIDLDRFADADQPDCVAGTLFVIKDPGPELRLRRQGEVSNLTITRSHAKAQREWHRLPKIVGAGEYGADS